MFSLCSPRALLCLSSIVWGCGGETPATPDAAALDRAAPDVSPDRDDASLEVSVDAAVDARVDAPRAPQLAWRMVPTMGAGPYGRWGIMAAERGDGTAILQGGATLSNAGGGRVFNETWTFDGRGAEPVFARVETTGSVPGRYCGCVGYDRRRNVLVMVGGRTPAISDPETWQLDMQSRAWTQTMTTTTPAGVIGCSMAWSEARGALYLFGGGSMSGYLGGIWRFDPAANAWVALEATGPRGRYDAALQSINGGRTFVLFGGSRSAVASGTFFRDVWRFDVMAERWEEIMAEGPAPEPRRTPWVLVEPGEASMIVGFGTFGIQPEENYNDVWRFEFASRRWTVLTFAEGAPTPSGRGFVSALPAGPRGGGWLVGGFDGTDPINDLWILEPRQ